MPPLDTTGGRSRFSSRERLAIDAALLGTVADAQVRDIVRRKADPLSPVDHDRAGAPSRQPEDGFQRRGAPGAVAPQQRHQLAAVHREIDAVQDMGLPVEGVQARDPQEFEMRDEGADAASAGSVPLLIGRPHVGFEHLGIFARPRCRALRRGSSPAADRDGVRKVRHHGKIVLHHQDGAVGGYLPDQLDDPPTSSCPMPCVGSSRSISSGSIASVVAISRARLRP